MDNNVLPATSKKTTGPRHLAQPYDKKPTMPTQRVSIHPMIWLLAVFMGIGFYLMISFGGP